LDDSGSSDCLLLLLPILEVSMVGKTGFAIFLALTAATMPSADVEAMALRWPMSRFEPVGCSLYAAKRNE
jgi:hypothetical protein